MLIDCCLELFSRSQGRFFCRRCCRGSKCEYFSGVERYRSECKLNSRIRHKRSLWSSCEHVWCEAGFSFFLWRFFHTKGTICWRDEKIIFESITKFYERTYSLAKSLADNEDDRGFRDLVDFETFNGTSKTLNWNSSWLSAFSTSFSISISWSKELAFISAMRYFCFCLKRLLNSWMLSNCWLQAGHMLVDNIGDDSNYRDKFKICWQNNLESVSREETLPQVSLSRGTGSSDLHQFLWFHFAATLRDNIYICSDKISLLSNFQTFPCSRAVQDTQNYEILII